MQTQTDQPNAVPGASRVVAVTGATGFIGRNVVAALVAQGHTVRALARDRAAVFGCIPGSTRPEPSVEVVQGDVLEPGTLGALCLGADALVHLVGIRLERGPKVRFERVHVDGTLNVLAAAKQAGVCRIVHMSALGTRDGAQSEYYRSKHAAETLVRNAGIPWTILRPSLVLGKGGEMLGMVAAWVRGDEPPFLCLPYFRGCSRRPPHIQPLAVGDLAGAVVAAIGRDAAIGEVYPLGGPDVYDWPELLAALRDTEAARTGVGCGKPVVGIPAAAAVAMARGAACVGLGRKLPFGVSDVQNAIEDNTCDTAKAHEDLGFAPKDAIAGLCAVEEPDAQPA